MKRGLFTFTFIGVTTIFFLMVLSIHMFFPLVEHLFYDINFVLKSPKSPDDVIIVGIDAQSINEIGAMPWPRSRTARLIEMVDSLGAKTIAMDFLFPKRELDSTGSDSLTAVFSRLDNLVIGMRLDQVSDENFGAAVVAPNAFKHRFLLLNNQNQLGDYISYSAGRIDIGDQNITQYAKRAGYLNIATNRSNQKVRKLVHAIMAGDDYYPSFGVAAVAQHLNLEPKHFILDGYGAIHFDDITVPIESRTASLRLNYRGPVGTIKTISAANILSGNVDKSILDGKLVFIGITDALASPSDFFITPVGTQYPGVEIWATAAADILEKRWIHEVVVLKIINAIIILLIFPVFIIFFAGNKKRYAIIFGTVILLLSIFAEFYLLQYKGIYWNAGLHLYSWFALIFWLAFAKQEFLIIEKDALKLDPDISEDSLYPAPNEKSFLQIIPDTDTARWIASKLASISTRDTHIESMSTDKLLENFQNLAGGRIIKLLGSGGMADVYLVWHPRMEVYRAIKVLKPGQPQTWLDRFETEIRIFSNLNHTNIVQCYGVGEWQDLPYLDMEFISGSSFEDILLQNKKITAMETAVIGLLICRALNYAHKQIITVYGETYKGIIHRDLKPANILLSKDGKVKLTDFGIARPGAISLHTVDTGKVVGTLPYLAPEQLTGKSITTRADIYALGVTLYEFITGSRAYPQTDIATLITAKTNSDYKLLKSERSIPHHLSEIIDRAMNVDPSKRYATAEEMGKALENVIHSLAQDSETFLLAELVQRFFG